MGWPTHCWAWLCEHQGVSLSHEDKVFEKWGWCHSHESPLTPASLCRSTTKGNPILVSSLSYPLLPGNEKVVENAPLIAVWPRKWYGTPKSQAHRERQVSKITHWEYIPRNIPPGSHKRTITHLLCVQERWEVVLKLESKHRSVLSMVTNWDTQERCFWEHDFIPLLNT